MGLARLATIASFAGGGLDSATPAAYFFLSAANTFPVFGLTQCASIRAVQITHSYVVSASSPVGSSAIQPSTIERVLGQQKLNAAMPKYCAHRPTARFDLSKSSRFTPSHGRAVVASERMWRSVKQFELCGQHRDTQVSLGAREVRLQCL